MVSKTKSIALAVIAAVSLNASCAYYSTKKGLLNLLEGSGPCVEASLSGGELYCREYTGDQSTQSQNPMDFSEFVPVFQEHRFSLEDITNVWTDPGRGINTHDLYIRVENDNIYVFHFKNKLDAKQAANHIERLRPKQP